MANLDTRAKRFSGVYFHWHQPPDDPDATNAGEADERAVLVGRYGGLFGGVAPPTPVNTGFELVVIADDEVAVGGTTRVWVEYTDEAAAVALDAAPTLKIFHLDTAGARTQDALVTMSASGEGYYYDWTPSSAGRYVLQAAGEKTAAGVIGHENVTARPRFDPIALALYDILVSRT